MKGPLKKERKKARTAQLDIRPLLVWQAMMTYDSPVITSILPFPPSTKNRKTQGPPPTLQIHIRIPGMFEPLFFTGELFRVKGRFYGSFSEFGAGDATNGVHDVTWNMLLLCSWAGPFILPSFLVVRGIIEFSEVGGWVSGCFPELGCVCVLSLMEMICNWTGVFMWLIFNMVVR